MHWPVYVYAVLVTVLIGWRCYMARGLPYSPEEDAIILSTSVTDDILSALRAAGFGERSKNAVKQRRNELRKAPGKMGPLTRSRPARDSLTGAAAAYDTARAHVARLEAELAEAKERASVASRALRERMEKEDSNA